MDKERRNHPGQKPQGFPETRTSPPTPTFSIAPTTHGLWPSCPPEQPGKAQPLQAPKGLTRQRAICDASTVSQRDLLPADFVVRSPFDSHPCKSCFTKTRERPDFLAINSQASLVAQMVKNLPTVQETRLRSLDWEENAHPLQLFLPREFHRQRSRAGYSPWDHKESDTAE